LSLFAKFKFLPNLIYAKWFQNLKWVGLDELQMTRDTHWWWWHCKNKRNANFAKCEIVGFVKKSQLCMSIVFDPR
jgi:hypothetical protein